MPVKSIIHISSRCGGGKSYHTITELHNHILKTKKDSKKPGFFLLASKTNKLTKQNYDKFHEECQQSKSSITYKFIDSTTTASNVMAEISDYMRCNKDGVLFVSHSAVSRIQPILLKDTTLIFDEVPDNLVKGVRLFHEARDQGQTWEKFISYQTQCNSQVLKVTLNQSTDPNEVIRYINNIQTKKDNVTTENVAEMLQFLLDDHEDMYFMSKKKKEVTTNYYMGIDWKILDELRTYTSSIVILSAELKKTLLGFVAQKIAGLDIQEQSITSTITLHALHNKKAIIYPILKDKTWSTFIKGKLAADVLIDQSLNILQADTVLDHALRKIATQMSGLDYLLILNKKDRSKDVYEKDNIKIISSSSHGSNNYIEYHHAAYLASKRPDPIEIISFNLFASKHNLIQSELIDSVITERCHESAYQCLARTSIRDANYSLEGPHLFFVPDMEYAEYVASWFEQGYATIDTSQSCTVQDTKSKQTKTKKDIGLLTFILTTNRSIKTPINVLLKQVKISTATYNRLRAKHKASMQQLGLMK
jgi:hypothetical protein